MPSFQFQLAVQRPAVPVVVPGGPLIRVFVQRPHHPFQLRVVDHDEVPRLHESDRGGVMGRRQNPEQHLLREWICPELRANVAPFEDRPVHRVTLGLTERLLGLPVRPWFLTHLKDSISPSEQR